MRSPHHILRILMLLLLGVVLALPTLAAAAPLPGDTFEADDGNIAATVLDWANANPQVFFDTPTASDSSFTTGAQEDVPNQTWTIVNQPVANKADIERLYVSASFPYLRLGIVRNQQATGTGSYNIELNQSSLKHPNGLAVRTAGDAMIIFDFNGNNPVGILSIHRWVTSGPNTQCVGNAVIPCWGPATLLDATQAVGANNTAQITDTVADPDVNLGVRTFDELAVNLQTALNIPAGQCINFGQTWLRTRAGGAFGSALIDLMGPVAINVGNCDVGIEKDVVAVNGNTSLNPSSVPFNATLEYRVRVFLGAGSTPVALNALTVTDSTISDPLFTNTLLVPVLVNGDIVGDDGDELLEQGERWVYALSASGTPVVQVASYCANVVNTATVSVAGEDTNPANNTATRTTPVVCVPDLAIDKAAPATVAFGDTITYSVDVSNVGDPVAVPRADVHVTDPAISAAELAFFSVVTGDPDTLLEQGEVWRYRLAGGVALTRPANVCAPINNTAAVAALTGETNLSNNSDTVQTTVTCVPDIAITKTAPASVAFGATIPYTVSVTSVGNPLPIARADLIVTDPAVAGGAPLAFFAETTGDGDTLLESGEVWEYRLAGGGAVTATASTCNPVDNTAFVAPVAGEVVTTNNQSSVTTTVTCVPDLAIVKSGPATVTKGETITYTIDVSSIGDPLPIPRADVTVTDALLTPGNLAFDSVVTGDTDTLLEQGEVWRYTVTAGAPATLVATTCGNVVNTAKVAPVSGETATANNTSSVTTFVRCPDYTVVKSAGAASVPFSAGSVSWSVAVTNTGNVDLAMPTLTDATVSLTGPTSTGNAGDGVFAIGEVLTYAGTEQIAGRCGAIANTVSAVVVDGQVQITRESTATTTVVCTPDVAIQKTGPQSVNFGDTITYAVSVRSVGDPLPIPKADLVVTDPAVGATPLAFFAETTGNGDEFLNPGEVWEYRSGAAPVTLPANVCGTVNNTAIVALTGDGNPANNQSTVSTAVICTLNLGITKTSDKATYAAGELITYTITVTNSGQAAVPFADIQVADPSLPGLTLVGTAPTELAAGASLTYTGTRQTTIADCGVVPNTATVAITADVAETTLADNSATRNVTVTCTTDLAIAKSADKPSYAPGETIAYTVTVHNTGQTPVPFGEIAVSDPTLPNLTLVGPAPATLAVGGSLTYTGTRLVSAADCGNVVNTATVGLIARAAAEATLTNNTASVTVTVAGGACNPPVIVIGESATTLAITKVGPAVSQVRRAVKYTLRITNTGGAVARNVIVRDPVPAGMSVAKLPSNATLAKGQIRWSIGDLQPGQSVTVSVLLRAEKNVTRRICNVGFASAANAPEVNGRACTRFVKLAGAVRVPVVTG